MESHKCVECGHLHYLGREQGYEPCLIDGCDCLGQTEDGQPARSYQPEVLVEGKWSTNALRFATETEAAEWAKALLYRWFVPTDSRAALSADEVNTRLVDGQLERIEVAS